MTESEYLRAVLDGNDRRLQEYFVNVLKVRWYPRERAYAATHGRKPTCDCLFYEDGDYAAAHAEALKLLSG